MTLASFSERSFEYFLRTYELFTDPTIVVFTTIFQMIGLCFTLLQCFGCPILLTTKSGMEQPSLCIQIKEECWKNQ